MLSSDKAKLATFILLTLKPCLFEVAISRNSRLLLLYMYLHYI